MKSRKKRLASGLTVVEGPRSVLDVCQSSELVQQILILEKDWDLYAAQVQQIYDNHNDNMPYLTPVTSTVLESLADTVTPQGILAVVKIPDGLQKLQKQQSPPAHPLYLLLDGVSDPGNLGTLLRSAVAVGVRAVLLLPGATDPYAPKALRSAMACAFGVPLVPCNSWSQAVDHLHAWHEDSKVQIWAATMEHDVPGTPHDQVNWTSNTASALVIGKEGQGLSDDVRQALRQDPVVVRPVHVPMMPNSVESLNAGVCGSVILFEYYRQVLQQQKGAAGNNED